MTTACGTADKTGNATDRAFIAHVVSDHRTAIAMAEIARRESRRRQIRWLAQNIITGERRQIAVLERLDDKLARRGVGVGRLAADDASDLRPGQVATLRSRKPFDRVFVDTMTRHHLAVIQIANFELAKGADADAKAVAKAVLTAQTREVGQMGLWRIDWYGGPVPAIP